MQRDLARQLLQLLFDKEGIGMKQMFVVVSRNIDEYVQTVVCEDFIEACATQAGLLVGMPAEAMKQLLKKEDIMTIKENLEKV